MPPDSAARGEARRFSLTVGLSVLLHIVVVAVLALTQRMPDFSEKIIVHTIVSPPPLGDGPRLPGGLINRTRALARTEKSPTLRQREMKPILNTPRPNAISPVSAPEMLQAEGGEYDDGGGDEGNDGPAGGLGGEGRGGSPFGVIGGTGIFQGTQLDGLPQILRQVEPDYPLAARKAGIETRIVVRALIEPDGSVSQVEVVRGAPELGFDASAIEAIRQWLFSPPKVAGVAVRAWMVIPVNFKLTN